MALIFSVQWGMYFLSQNSESLNLMGFFFKFSFIPAFSLLHTEIILNSASFVSSLSCKLKLNLVSLLDPM